MKRKFIVFLCSIIIFLCTIYSAQHKNQFEINPIKDVQICDCIQTEMVTQIIIAACLEGIVFVIASFLAISFPKKIRIWKATLPVFWGCKYRIQSPRCKLSQSNKCSVLS